MSQSLSGRVALITGAARGQGRAYAVRLSAEGADIIAVDLAGPLPSSVPYDSPTPADLAETAQLVDANGRRVITAVVDIRDLDALQAAVDKAVGELGRLDIVVANAGICSPAPWDQITGSLPRHHRHERDRYVEHRDGECSSHHRYGPWRVDHPDRLRGRRQNGAVHGPLRGEQTRRHRYGPRIRRRTGSAQHPRQ